MKRQNFRIHNRKQLHKVSLKSQKYSSILVALKIPKKFNKMAAKFEKKTQNIITKPPLEVSFNTLILH